MVKLGQPTLTSAGGWKEYFNEQLNVENSSEIEEDESVEGPLQDVTKAEVETWNRPQVNETQ